MYLHLPPFVSFLDPAMMGLFWGYVKWFLFILAPIIMIWFAVEVVGRFVGIVKGTVEEAGEENEYRRRRKWDDEDDFY